jgi:hypothetical protein
MADTIPFKFAKSITDDGNSVGIEITSQAPKEVWSAIIGNKPLPAIDFELAKSSVRASAGKDFALGSKRATFDGNATLNANAYASLGVYGKPETVTSVLKIDGQDPIQLDLPAAGSVKFGVLRWGYEIAAAAKGAVALGGWPGSIGLSGQAKSDGMQAVVRSIDPAAPATATARTALQSVVEAFRLPSQVDGIARSSPGPGSRRSTALLELGAKATFGWDFDWIRSVRGGGSSATSD